ncbi:MAG: GNAT family N-acetyltransferase [Treponema sp.]|nr:GNAT family N-acetyltransferase [Treponema sp.]MCL2236820.1 GNAT family N-acetyltransferase [Treponema sp.]
MKNADTSIVESLLRENEYDYVSACGRFLVRDAAKDPIWILRQNKSKADALVINSRSTLIPVLCGMNQIPHTEFLNGFFAKKKIHSVQGLKNEVCIMEDALDKLQLKISDIYDYDLMSLEKMSVIKNRGIKNLVLKVPRLTDLDAIAPLQAAYEIEEVIPKGSAFSPAASRINIANIIAGGRVLAAEIDGQFVGKINVSAVSFTRYLVGGVYVHPSYRCLGIARFMAYSFISSLAMQGRGITLFVKKSNTAARKLYASLGFAVTGDYRITYC